MTGTTTEPAGAARFAAASYPNVIASNPSAAPSSFIQALKDAPEETMTALEARITELEGVVHTLTQYSRAAGHSKFVTWAESVAARIKAVL
jgi:hypothetical protein